MIFFQLKEEDIMQEQFIMPKDCIQIIWYFLKETIPLMQMEKCEFMAPVPKITTTEDGMTCRENGIAPKAYRFMVVWIIIYKQHVPEDFAFIQQTSFPLKKNFIWEQNMV